MTNKRQPPVAPERVYLSRFWANYIEHSCQFSYEQKQADDIPYARVRPVDDARVREIAEQVVGTVFDNTAASHETLRAAMVERIADYLLPRLSNSERRCVKCGHSSVGVKGTCSANTAHNIKFYVPCGCKCVFPTTGAGAGER